MSSKYTKQFNDGNHVLVLLAYLSDFSRLTPLPPMVNRLIIIVCFILPLKAMAQVLDFGVPEKLSLSVNSDAEEVMPLLSPDGKLLFFTRALHTDNVGGKYTGHDIWISEQIGKDWKKADNRKAGLNNKDNNVVIGVNGSGDILYLMDASSSKKVGGVYFSKREAGTWSAREFIPITGIESTGFLNFYMSPDFDVLFISMKGKDTKGEEDLYVSTKESTGEWSKPKNLGPTINTKGFEISPFLSDDKKRLYFSSNGHQGMGDADIFVSERLYGSWEAWSVPQNLGKAINSEKFDAYFSTYGDSVCFFASNRAGTSADIYASYWNSSRRREMQKKEVDRLIEESKSLLSEVREGTDKISGFTELQVLTFNDSELSPESKRALASEAPKILERNARVAVLGSSKPEFTRSSSLFSKVIKSELVKLGIDENKIIIPSGEDKILADAELQSRLMTLLRNELLLVLLP